MKTATQRIAWFVGAFALAVAAATVNARASEAFVSYPAAGNARFWTMPFVSQPRLSSKRMHWYHWHPAARSLQGRAAKFGSTAVIGLESMQDLAALRERYGFDRVLGDSGAPRGAGERRRRAAARAARERADRSGASATSLRSGRGAGRRACRTTRSSTRSTRRRAFRTSGQFAAAHVDRALDFTPGSPRIVVGVIDTGVDNVPDLAGKIDSLWSVNGTHGRRSVGAGRQRRRRPRHRGRVADRGERRRRLRHGRLRRSDARDRRPRQRPGRILLRHLGRDRADEARLARRPDRQHEPRRPDPVGADPRRRHPQGGGGRHAPRGLLGQRRTATSAGPRRICSRPTADEATGSRSAPRRSTDTAPPSRTGGSISRSSRPETTAASAPACSSRFRRPATSTTRAS